MLWWSLNRTCHFTSSLLDNVRSYHLGEIEVSYTKIGDPKISCLCQACNVTGRSVVSGFQPDFIEDYMSTK